ncbi:hypothetical protein [Rhodoferax antarcticus]|nr:hypothetical protein [Rhodoferax antarcticus]MCW2310898.1 hypothetical protein [Rhodoferax antarcticus]
MKPFEAALAGVPGSACWPGCALVSEASCESSAPAGREWQARASKAHPA